MSIVPALMLKVHDVAGRTKTAKIIFGHLLHMIWVQYSQACGSTDQQIMSMPRLSHGADSKWVRDQPLDVVDGKVIPFAKRRRSTDGSF